MLVTAQWRRLSIIFACFFSGSATVLSATFGGVPLPPGATIRVAVPLTPQARVYASEGGNIAPASAIAIVAAPIGFNPARTCPVVIVFSSSDGARQNGDDLVDFYREPAFREGCLLIAGDSPQPPHLDNAAWRAAMTLAALDALHRSFPGSVNWPVTCAGFSGGAKRAGFIAPLLAKSRCRIAGIFLAGIGDDRLSDGYRKFAPGADFLNTPVFISSGRDDFVAPFNQQLEVKLSILKTGFNRVRHETFSGKHALKLSHFVDALRWFRSLSMSSPKSNS